MSRRSHINLSAIAAYITALRKRQHLSQAELAQRVGVHPRQVQNWEGSGKGTRASSGSAPTLPHARQLMIVLGGSLEHLAALAANEQATAEEAIALAQMTMPEPSHYLASDPHVIEATRLLSDTQFAEMVRLFERLREKSPDLARQFLDYGHFLEDKER
jgi:transcriptional regulator with XRE-family HTH domain